MPPVVFNENFHAGDLMMITDQISSFVPSPLIGANREDLGPRFPDMSEIYRREYRKIIRESSKALNIDLQEGTYLQFTVRRMSLRQRSAWYGHWGQMQWE